MWVTSARFVHCPRCTNCSRQFCTDDFSQWLTRNKQKIRLASDRRRYTRTKEHLYRQTKRATFSTSRKEQSKVIRCPACCPTQFFNTHWRTKFNDDKSKKERVYPWATTIMTASRTWYLPTTWCSSQLPKHRYGKCCVNSRKQQRKWASGSSQTRRKFSATRAPSTGTQKKHLEVDHVNIEILTRNDSVKFSNERISFYQLDTTEIKSRIRAAWATFHKYRQELTSKNCMVKHRLRLFDATVSPTVCYAAGTWAPNKEHERMIQPTQRKMLRLIIQVKKEIQKDCETRCWAQRRKFRSWHQWNV